jgi:fumarate reductase subunit D
MNYLRKVQSLHHPIQHIKAEVKILRAYFFGLAIILLC